MGWTNVFNCEWEEFPQRVLKHHFPNAKQYGDIKELDATAYAGRIDILTGGFPCQPYSLAGKRKGKEDERHLWPEMLRVIRECTPRWVVGENVRGLVGWNGGLVFEEVCADLETCGYSVQPFILPAAGVGAPHRRDRVWFVAYANHEGRGDGHGQVQRADGEVRQRNDRSEPCDAGDGVVANASSQLLKRDESAERRSAWEQAIQQENRKSDSEQSRTMGKNGNASDTDGLRLQHTQESGSVGQSKGEARRCATKSAQTDGGIRNASDTDDQERQRRSGTGEQERQKGEQGRDGVQRTTARLGKERNSTGTTSWARFPTVPPVCGGDDGLPKELDGITFSKWRRESIKAYGNAIVPQVALQIFKAINEYENGT